jgi:hypothetical protein
VLFAKTDIFTFGIILCYILKLGCSSELGEEYGFDVSAGAGEGDNVPNECWGIDPSAERASGSPPVQKRNDWFKGKTQFRTEGKENAADKSEDDDERMDIKINFSRIIIGVEDG